MDKTKNKIIDDLKKFKEKISKDYEIEKFIFFGSRSVGKPNKDSDVDIMLVSRNFNGKSVLKRSPELYLKWDLEYSVDFLCYTPEEFDNLRNKITIVREAARKGIEI